MNTIFLGDSLLSWEDLCNFEPQNDHINVQIGQDFLDGNNSSALIMGPPLVYLEDLTEIDDITMTFYAYFKIKNNIPTLEQINPNIKMIYNREK